jgi:hypothetical protein
MYPSQHTDVATTHVKRSQDEVNFFICVESSAIKAHRSSEIKLHSCQTWAVHEGEWPASCSSHLKSGTVPRCPMGTRRMGPRIHLNIVTGGRFHFPACNRNPLFQTLPGQWLSLAVKLEAVTYFRKNMELLLRQLSVYNAKQWQGSRKK